MTQFHGTIKEEPLTEEQAARIRRKLPAFPVQRYDGSWIDGMDLRDYFAAKAMQSLLSFDLNTLATMAEVDGYGEQIMSWVCYISYRYADTMMKAREA